MQITFEKTEQARKLTLSTFSWNSNNLSRKFQGSNTAEGFIEMFKNVIISHANTEVTATEVTDQSQSPSSPARKRPRTLLPASQEARTLGSASASEDGMDKAVIPFFQGIL